MSKQRINPFKSNRTNFPPLDDFFADDTTTNDQRSHSDDDAATDPGNNGCTLPRSASNHSFHSRSKTCNDVLNFSVDMSIGCKADLAQHRYQVQKYGLEDSYQLGSPFRGSPTCTPSKRGRRLLYNGGGGGDDTWDRLMDDTNCSNVSFSSTAIVGGIKSSHHTINKAAVGYHTPSPEESPDQSVDSNDTSSNYLGKSVIQSLVTPEKRRYKLTSSMDDNKTSGVTFTRGQIHYESSEDEDEGDDNSPQRSATGSGFERMFHAALRFNEDFDYESSFIKEENGSSVEADNSYQSNEKEDGRDRYSSVSFAADTSFATSDGKFLATLCQQNKRQQENRDNHFTEGDEEKESFNAKDTLKELDLSSASPIHHEQDNSFRGANLSFGERSSPLSNEISSLESPGLTPSPNNSGETTSLQKPRSTDLQFLGLSPIDNLKSADRRTLRSPTIAPFDEKHRTSGEGISPVPFDESFQSNTVQQHVNSHSSIMTDCTKRNLFQDDEKDIACNVASHELGLEISHDSIEMMVQQKKSSIDQCCTHTTVKSEESYFYNDVLPTTATTSLSEEVSPYSYTRTFGSNAAFRINSNVTNVGRSLCHSNVNDDSTFHDDGGIHRRGVRLCRLSKMKELGLDHALLTQSRKKSATSWKQCGDNSF